MKMVSFINLVNENEYFICLVAENEEYYRTGQ